MMHSLLTYQDKYTIALEPAYFDKTADYPIGCEDNKYILTQQNAGAIALADGKVVCSYRRYQKRQRTCLLNLNFGHQTELTESTNQSMLFSG